MAVAKRVLLFLITNILVLLTINLTLSLLGVNRYLGPNYTSLLIFCAAFGFGGAFISLFISKWMAKMAYRIQVIDPQRPGSQHQAKILSTVYELASRAGIKNMPEVGIYESPEVNAFATGRSKNNALVAVSTGLLSHMSTDEVEGVLGHEIAHVTNGDMVTMTLIQGVINTFVMFFARIVASIVSNALRSNDDDGPGYMAHYFLVFVFEIMFSLLGAIVVAFFSRWREFRADSGGAQYAGRDKMIGALSSLRRYKDAVDLEHQAFATLKINGIRRMNIAAMFSTHPSLEERISRLQEQSA